MTRAAPAAVPAFLGLLVFALASTGGLRAPIGLSILLLAAGLALGGRLGVAALALGAGLAGGVARIEEQPLNDAERVAEVEGRICGNWRGRAEIDQQLVRFCPDWIVQAGRTLARPPRLWLAIPGALDPPPFGASVRAVGSLSRFPGFANAAARAPGPWRLRVKSRLHLSLRAEPSPAARSASRLRATLDRRIGEGHRSRGNGVAFARALVLGDDDALPESWRRALRRVGLSHLLAVSGFNLTLVAALALLAGSALAGRSRLALPAAAVALYVVAVGQEPSVLRAALMAGGALSLAASRRRAAPLQSLAIAALGVTALDPALVREPGLQLSCAATAGLLIGAWRWSQAFAPLPRPIAVGLGASLAAQAGALPSSVATFAELSIVSPLANLVALPWAVVATVLSLAWVAVALVSSRAAAFVEPLLDRLVDPIGLLERLPPSPWISTSLEGGVWGGALVAIAIIGIVEARLARRGGLALLAIALALIQPVAHSAPRAEVAFFDVGQGDAALVHVGRTALLIDGGGLLGRDIGTDVVRAQLARRGIVRLDAAVVSHAHRDHCAGVAELALQLPIAELLVDPGTASSDCVVRAARSARARVRPLRDGATWMRGPIALEAFSAPDTGDDRDPNSASLVVRIRALGRSVLFTGDLDAAGERALVGRAPERLASAILKVAHHGSARSSTRELLDAVGARLAIVSAGARNPFGHPSSTALARLAASGARVLRTDRDGEVGISWSAGGPLFVVQPASPRVDPSLVD